MCVVFLLACTICLLPISSTTIYPLCTCVHTPHSYHIHTAYTPTTHTPTTHSHHIHTLPPYAHTPTTYTHSHHTTTPPIPTQELSKQNPQLLQLINSNQQEFLRLLGEPPAEGEAADLAAQLGEGMEGGMDEEEGQGMPGMCGRGWEGVGGGGRGRGRGEVQGNVYVCVWVVWVVCGFVYGRERERERGV